MYRSILVPLDGTEFGEHALPAAVALARRTGAALHLVHVHAPEGVLEGILGGGRQEVTLRAERGYLDGVADRVRGLAGVPVDARVLDGGPVGRTLAEVARTAAADVVALATHGRTGVGRLWHRGVAAYLTRHLSVPILAVHAPEGPPPPLDRHFEFRHVLLPLGGSTYSEAVLDHAARLGEAFGARFTLLRVVEPPTEIGYTLLGQDGHVNHFQLEDLHEAATAQLQAPAGRLRERGIDALVDVADSAEPAEAILEYARESGADLIAMETHGLGTAAHLFAASVVEDVVHGARVPVLLHHADAPVAGERAYEDSIRRGMGWSAHGAAEEPAAPAG